MARPRLVDGKLIYPRRGSPPTVPEGYARDPGDPYVLILNFPECKNRSIALRILPCGRRIEEYACSLDLSVTAQNCLNCIQRTV